jgi:hypothetical protein
MSSPSVSFSHSFTVSYSCSLLTDCNGRRSSRHGLLELPRASLNMIPGFTPAHLIVFRMSLGGLLLVYVSGTRSAAAFIYSAFAFLGLKYLTRDRWTTMERVLGFSKAEM